MFSAQQIFAIYNISLAANIYVGYDTYVYLEDQDEIANLHLRKWDWNSPGSIMKQDVINVAVERASQSEVDFQMPLWIAATEALDLK